MASTWNFCFSWRTRGESGLDADCHALWQHVVDMGQTRWTAEIYDDLEPQPRSVEIVDVSNERELGEVARRGRSVIDFAPPPMTSYEVRIHTAGVQHRIDATLGCNIVYPFEPDIHGLDVCANSLWLHVKGAAAPAYDRALAYFTPIFVSCVRRFDALLLASLDQGDDTVYYPERVRSSNSVTVPAPGFMFYINREHYDPLPPLGDDARVVDIDGKGSLVIMNHEPWSMENDAVFEAIERVDLTLQKAGVMRQPKYLRGHYPDENLPGWRVPPNERGIFDA